jgi:hypothetical protein
MKTKSCNTGDWPNMELYRSFNRDKILSAANKISHLHYYMVETKLIPTAFRRKEAIGTKICTAVW